MSNHSSPVITEFVDQLYHDWTDEQRQRLAPYLQHPAGVSDPATESARAWLVLDCLCREHLPAWLEAAGLAEEASRIRSLPPILSAEAARRAAPALEAVRDRTTSDRLARWVPRDPASLAAAWTKSVPESGEEAWSRALAVASTEAAHETARDAIGGEETRDVVWSAILSAAWLAAGFLAQASTLERLPGIVERLQVSALQLLDRMIEARP